MSYTKWLLNGFALSLSLILTLVACATSTTLTPVEHATHLDNSLNHVAHKLDAKAVIFVDAKGSITLTDSNGKIIQSCGRKCRVFTEKSLVKKIESITVLRSKINPCIYTYFIDSNPYEIIYQC